MTTKLSLVISVELDDSTKFQRSWEFVAAKIERVVQAEIEAASTGKIPRVTVTSVKEKKL